MKKLIEWVDKNEGLMRKAKCYCVTVDSRIPVRQRSSEFPKIHDEFMENARRELTLCNVISADRYGSFYVVTWLASENELLSMVKEFLLRYRATSEYKMGKMVDLKEISVKR